MGFDVEIRGLDEAQRKLRRLRDNLEKFEGTRTVPLEDLVTPAFLGTHTKHSSLEQLVREGRFLPPGEALTAERFEAIPSDAWDTWIARTTKFPTWRALLDAAAAEYIKRWLVEGL